MSQVQPHPMISGIGLSPEQARAALTPDRDIVVTAGAGTGKTRTLVARYLALLAGGMPLRSIIAVTFTRKAAQEMRNRVRREMDAYLQAPGLTEAERTWWDDQRALLDAARIGTIHTLCGEILRTHPAEAGLDPRFQVLEEAPARLLQSEAVTAALAWAVEERDAVAVFRLIPEFTLRTHLARLLQARLDAALAFAGLPAAGSRGAILAQWRSLLEAEQSAALKRLLTSAAWQRHQEALFGNEADAQDDLMEIQRRAIVAALGEAAGRQDLAGKLAALVAVGQINLKGGRPAAWPGGKPQLVEVKAALDGLRQLWRAESVLGLQLSEADGRMAEAIELLGRLFQRAATYYQGQKQARYALDFDDLEDGAIRLLQEHPAARDYWQATARAVLVDEFQDTNGRQRQLVRLLCPEPGKLFIVGDAKQSIYRFRGADVTVFRQEEEQIARGGGLSQDLETSYRAHQGLLTGLNALMRPILGEPGDDRLPWETPFGRLVHHKEAAAPGLASPYIEVHLATGSKADGGLVQAARALVTRLDRLVASTSLGFGDVAILCRASTSFAAYEDALDEAGIPFVTVAGKGFYERPEIRELLNGLSALADPNDDLALAGLLRSPAIGLSDAALFHLSQARARSGANTLWQTMAGGLAWAGEEAAAAARAATLIGALNQQAGRTSVADLLKAFLDETDYRAALLGAGLTRGVRNVAKLLNDAQNSGLVSVGDFLEYVTGLRDTGSREGEARATDGGAVQIMTVHQAKGLEFPLVVIGDATYRSRRTGSLLIDPRLGVVLNLPLEETEKSAIWQLARLRESSQEQAEDQRLFYVAATRAEQMLLFNGCITLSEKTGLPNGLAGWLKPLAELAGLHQWACSQYEADGSGAHTTDLLLAETPVMATLYEGNFPGVLPPAAAGEGKATQKTPLPPPYLSLTPPEAGLEQVPDEAPDGSELPQKVWQVVASLGRPMAPAWIVGKLVHEALAQWRLRAPGLDGWLEARAQAHGLLDARRLDHAVSESRRILDRFQNHPLYGEIDRAQRRWHELPFNLAHDRQPARGIIDLLYEADGRWTVIDFKSDRLRDEAQLEQQLQDQGYAAQVARYGEAVETLVGQRPRLILCLLNFAGQIHLHTF